jgi:polar amino acid transport system substrate-binding protein
MRRVAVSICAVFGLAILLGGLAWAAAPLRLACNDFPPHKIETPGADGLLGFDVDIINEALRRTGWTAKISFLPWKRALEFAIRGDIDGLCSCSRTPEREATLVFSDELGAVSVGVFARDAAALGGIARIEDMKGRRVAVVGGYNLEGELSAAGAIVEAASSDKNALDMLVGGNIDLLYGYELTTRHFMRTEAAPAAVDYRELRRNPYYFCLSRKLPEAEATMADFNRGLAEMRTDGSIARILARYGVTFR